MSNGDYSKEHDLDLVFRTRIIGNVPVVDYVNRTNPPKDKDIQELVDTISWAIAHYQGEAIESSGERGVISHITIDNAFVGEDATPTITQMEERANGSKP